MIGPADWLPLVHQVRDLASPAGRALQALHGAFWHDAALETIVLVTCWWRPPESSKPAVNRGAAEWFARKVLEAASRRICPLPAPVEEARLRGEFVEAHLETAEALLGPALSGGRGRVAHDTPTLRAHLRAVGSLHGGRWTDTCLAWFAEVEDRAGAPDPVAETIARDRLSVLQSNRPRPGHQVTFTGLTDTFELVEGDVPVGLDWVPLSPTVTTAMAGIAMGTGLVVGNFVGRLPDDPAIGAVRGPAVEAARAPEAIAIDLSNPVPLEAPEPPASPPSAPDAPASATGEPLRPEPPPDLGDPAPAPRRPEAPEPGPPRAPRREDPARREADRREAEARAADERAAARAADERAAAREAAERREAVARAEERAAAERAREAARREALARAEERDAVDRAGSARLEALSDAAATGARAEPRPRPARPAAPADGVGRGGRGADDGSTDADRTGGSGGRVQLVDAARTPFPVLIAQLQSRAARHVVDGQERWLAGRRVRLSNVGGRGLVAVAPALLADGRETALRGVLLSALSELPP